jgi:hypothetical protein
MERMLIGSILGGVVLRVSGNVTEWYHGFGHSCELRNGMLNVFRRPRLCVFLRGRGKIE